MGPEVGICISPSRDHARSQRFYEAYFGFRFEAVFPRGDEPPATIRRSLAGFEIVLEGPSGERLPSWFYFGFFVPSDVACRDLHGRMQRNAVGGIGVGSGGALRVHAVATGCRPIVSFVRRHHGVVHGPIHAGCAHHETARQIG
ncbi:MAG: hypothetical protein ABSE49_30390 [Polyangiaceae bacterium]|jgi:catechol 2,3-dioxygenase-like lactoylglutathione lyase family enzyme